jgi:chitin disaccharide deacetylase
MKSETNWICLLLLMVFSPATAAAQSAANLAERLGYPKDAKLLIIHADDVAETHAVNAATFQALESGAVNSASIMVPCPWFPEAADYAKSHPQGDFGLHLTLTSERVYYRWGPVAGAEKVPSLVDQNGYFHHDWDQHPRIDPRDVETELRAQIERALAMGVRPTHFDSHQYRLIENGKEIFQVFVRLGHEYKVPVFVTRDWFAEHPYLEASLGPGDLLVDHTVTISPDVPAEKWPDFYRGALKNLQPGVTEFVIHVGLNDEELRAATRERTTWGAAWRQRDFDFFMSREFRELLEQQHVKLITWRELAKAAANR